MVEAVGRPPADGRRGAHAPRSVPEGGALTVVVAGSPHCFVWVPHLAALGESGYGLASFTISILYHTFIIKFYARPALISLLVSLSRAPRPRPRAPPASRPRDLRARTRRRGRASSMNC